MKRRFLIKAMALCAVSLPTLVSAAGKSYRGKLGSVSYSAKDGNGFTLEVNGLSYLGEFKKGGVNRLGTALRDGEHKITIDGKTTTYSIKNGQIKLDLDNGPPVIKPVEKHIGPAVGVILIILVIYGKWPPKPKKGVSVQAGGASFELTPA